MHIMRIVQLANFPFSHLDDICACQFMCIKIQSTTQMCADLSFNIFLIK